MWIFSVFCRKSHYVYSQVRILNYPRYPFVRRCPFLYLGRQIALYGSRYTSMDQSSGSQWRPLFRSIAIRKKKNPSLIFQFSSEYVQNVLTSEICATPGAPHVASFFFISAKSTFFVAAKSSRNLL